MPHGHPVKSPLVRMVVVVCLNFRCNYTPIPIPQYFILSILKEYKPYLALIQVFLSLFAVTNVPADTDTRPHLTLQGRGVSLSLRPQAV